MKLEYQRGASARLFESPFLETCSKVHPVAPFAFYIPIVVALMVYAVAGGKSSPLQAIFCFPFGWLTWDLMEYGIHRAFFHWEGSGPITRKIHAIMHGYHHQYPDDSLRFFGARLHEVGMIKTSPQKLIAQGTDWRFLNELKKELKG